MSKVTVLNIDKVFQDYKTLIKEKMENNPQFFIHQGHTLLSADKSHIIDVATNLCMVRDEHYQNGGGFIKAILNNDLEATVGRADRTMKMALQFMVYVKQYVHL